MSERIEVSELIVAIQELHVRREQAIRMQIRIQNACGGYARRLLGWRLDLPEAERTAIAKEAAKAVAMLMADEHADVPHAMELTPVVDAARLSIPPWEGLAAVCEKRMAKLAAELPAVAFVETVRGFGTTGFAQIVGEAGDLAGYANPAKLWKRMGLAVAADGKCQRKSTDPETAAAMGYNPRRRSIMWRIGDSLLKGNKDGYREMYLSRKAMELERLPADEKGRKMHAHRRAQRYVEKRLLRDLWRAWRGLKAHDGQTSPAAPLS